jgi:hypothetical protein
MATDKIQGFNLNRRGLTDLFRQTERADDAHQNRVRSPVGESVTKTPVPTDKAEISATAHQLMALRRDVIAGREALAQEPEVRAELVQEVRKRLRQGYYRSVSVENHVADRLDRLIRNLEDL